MPLTAFQKRKLARMFAVLDLDRDGYLQRSDYTRRVDAVARMKGWTQESPEDQRNLRFALQDWEGLCESADVDQDDRDAVRSYSRGDAQLLFDAMDTDGDGKISLDEYRAYLDVCGIDAS